MGCLQGWYRDRKHMIHDAASHWYTHQSQIKLAQHHSIVQHFKQRPSKTRLLKQAGMIVLANAQWRTFSNRSSVRVHALCVEQHEDPRSKGMASV